MTSPHSTADPMPAARVRQTTSIGAYKATRTHRTTQLQQVLDVLKRARANGTRNMTGAELCDALQREHPLARWSDGKVAARVNALVAMGDLVRCPEPRLSNLPGSFRQCLPIALAAEQTTLPAWAGQSV